MAQCFDAGKVEGAGAVSRADHPSALAGLARALRLAWAALCLADLFGSGESGRASLRSNSDVDGVRQDGSLVPCEPLAEHSVEDLAQSRLLFVS